MKSFKQFIQPHEYPTRTTFAPKGSLGIPRNQMPQITQKDVPAFLKHLKDQGIPVEETELMPTDIHLTQLEINQDKVNGMKDFDDNTRSIVSQHNQLLDGHHRIVAKQQFKPTLATKVWRVGLPIMTLIQHAKAFPKSFTKSVH